MRMGERCRLVILRVVEKSYTDSSMLMAHDAAFMRRSGLFAFFARGVFRRAVAKALVFTFLLQACLVWTPRGVEASGDGTIDSTIELNGDNSEGPTVASLTNYGQDIDTIGDLDGDGNNEIVVGMPSDGTGFTAGNVFIHFLRDDGTARKTTYIKRYVKNAPTFATGDDFGTSVAGIGDLDGDGVPDIAVGAVGDDTGASAAGAVYIIYLNEDGSIKSTVELNSSTTNGATGLLASDNYGSSVANIGDLNDDGVNDLAVGAQLDDTNGSSSGSWYIHFMNTDGSVDSTVKIHGTTTNGAAIDTGDQYGSSIAGLGDLNLDGVEDIAVGAPNRTGGTFLGGAIYIHFMNTDGSMDSTALINEDTANGPVFDSNDEWGESISLIGDLNNDGVKEIAVGAERGGLTTPDCGGVSECGAVNIMFMNTNGTIDSTVEITGNTANGPTLTASGDYGSGIADLGDLDGDGVEDIAVGAPLEDLPISGSGAVFFHYLNTNATLDSTARLDGTGTNGPTSLNTNDAYGEEVLGIGDLNDDGIEDIAVGNIGLTNGEMYISFLDTDGTPNSTVMIDGTTTNGPGTTSGYTSGMASLGDLNSDGVEDIAVGGSSTGTGGVFYIHYMNTDASMDSTVTISGATTNGPTGISANESYGASVANIGDLNDDGVIDIAVGAPNEDDGGSNNGSIFIHYMNTNGTIDSTVEINKLTANGPSALGNSSSNYGSAIAGIGDLNNDGVEDIAVGADYQAAGSPGDLGLVFIHFMNTDGTIDSTVTIGNGTANGPTLADDDRYGIVVTALGDYDGDSVEDIAVGASRNDTDGANAGIAFIHFLNSDGTVESTVALGNATANGPYLRAGDLYGSGIALIGDLDDNGTPDLAIGAPADLYMNEVPAGGVHIHFMHGSAPTNDPTLSNAVTSSRLRAGASSSYSFSFTLQNPVSGTLTITFPAGFTVTGALTGGTCVGGTIGTFGFTSSTLTAVKSGCQAGALTVSGGTVTNHSTPGRYHISWVNDDPGGGDIYLTDDDQVTVSANVDPTLTMNAGSQASVTACDGTFSGNGGTVALGALSVGAVSSSDASSLNHICTRLSTNASSGAVMTVKSLNGANGLVSASVPGDKIASPGGATTIVAGTAAYAICTGSAGGDRGNDAISGSASPARSSPFNGASCTSTGHNVGGLTTSAQSLWALSGPSQNAFVRVYVKAAISPVTPAHSDYTDTLTFIGTGTF